MLSLKSSLADRVILALFVVFHVNLTQGIKRYIAPDGKDMKNNCSNEQYPCKTIIYVVLISQDNDTIAISAGKSEIFTYDLKNENDSSIIIEKSLHFIGIKGQPSITSALPGFTFSVSNKERQIFLSLTNIKINGKQERKRKNSCRPSLSGIFLIKRAHLTLTDCIFETSCASIHIVEAKSAITSINIHGCSFSKVHYILFSKNSSLLTVNISSSDISGELGSKVPYYAISLRLNNAAFIHIVDSRFYRLNEAVAISMHEKWLKLRVSRCSFFKNSGQSILLSFSSAVDFEKTIIHLDYLNIESNDGRYASSVHLIRSLVAKESFDVSLPKIYISNCNFLDNCAQAFFGTVYADGVKLIIENSTFYNNTAGNQGSSLQAFGGALFVESETEVLVLNTTFVNNTCSGFGGTIFSRGSFSAINCKFTGSSMASIAPLLGDIIYATAGLYLQNTTWYPRKSYRSNSAIWHPGSPTIESWLIRIDGYFVAYCPIGHNITGYGMLRNEKMLSDRISMGCKSCPRDKYSLESGSIQIHSMNGKVTNFLIRNASCYGCQYGGICEHGRIKARSNYYGYEIGNPTQIRFLSCPVGYCCQQGQCQEYDSCSSTRQGRLCGRCIKGSTENLLSAKCIKEKNCNDIWFWFLYFPMGWFYILFFMYLDKISNFFKQQLIWCNEKKSDTDESKHELKNEDTIHSAEATENNTIYTEEPIDTTSRENVASNNHVEPEVCGIEDDGNNGDETTNDGSMSGQRSNNSLRNQVSNFEQSAATGHSFTEIVNITFYFYQIMLIIRIHDNVILSNTFALVKEMSTSIFTFSLDAESSLSLCPISGLTAVSKNFLIRSFAFYIVSQLVVMNLISNCYTLACFTLFKGRKAQNQQTVIDFSARLRVTTIQIILLAYSTITNMIMNLVNCVQIDSKTVLYIDGSITCFTWWQSILLLFIVSWLIPFPAALVFAIHQLRHNRISYNEFITALTAPFCYITFKIVETMVLKMSKDKDSARYHNQTIGSSRISDDEISKRQDDGLIVKELQNEIDTLSRTEILKRFEAPFTSTDEIGESITDIFTSKNPGVWPGVMIGRRLIIIMLSTFVNNPVTRMYSMLLACLLFLMHHLLSVPYKNHALNIFETVTSATLVLFCSMNLFFAYSYVSNVSPLDADNRISFLFDLLEVVLLAIMPASLLIILFLVLFYRLLALILQVCKGCVKFWS